MICCCDWETCAWWKLTLYVQRRSARFQSDAYLPVPLYQTPKYKRRVAPRPPCIIMCSRIPFCGTALEDQFVRYVMPFDVIKFEIRSFHGEPA